MRFWALTCGSLVVCMCMRERASGNLDALSRTSKLLGGGSVTGPGLDNVMRPLLREAQENVNQKHISGDQALGYLLEELPKRLATLAASKSDLEARMKIRGPRSEGQEGDINKPRKKSKKEITKVLSANRPEQTKCRTCPGNTGHESGRCYKCRLKDRQVAPAPAGPAAAPAQAAGEGGLVEGGCGGNETRLCAPFVVELVQR
jgi:hypothetical protein